MSKAVIADRTRDCPSTPECGDVDTTLTRAVIGGFYTVYNALGCGFLESVYAKALCRELTERGLHVAREVAVDVYYKGDVVGFFRADVLVESRLVLDIKALPVLPTSARRQLLNYPRCSDLEVGLLLNFGDRPTIRRVVASKGAEGNPPLSPFRSAES